METLSFIADEIFETDEWKQKMSVNAESLSKHNVRQILLVHGTFVGEDALGLFDAFKPIIGEALTNILKNEGKNLVNILTKDVGNYIPEYAKALGNALGQDISCELFTWSSGNFHLARLKGTFKLAQELAAKITENKILPHQRILLLGHSHAGQLFALLTTFLADDEQTQRLYEILDKYDDLKEAKKLLISHLEIIKAINLDFVTFGTPVRYRWGEYKKFRLIPIVNHRSKIAINGLLNTRDGDYVQQWGVEGTDMPAPLKPNDDFDLVLDKGRDVSLLAASVINGEIRNPKYNDGETVCDSLLIDYKDNALLPNWFKTLFGHGVYTENTSMLFNMNMIVKKLYS